MNPKTFFIGLLCAIGVVATLVAAAMAIVCSIQFDRGCGGYLKRAADANTVELAEKELAKAVKYLEDNNLTSGYTSVIYTTPDEDIGFFYTNLRDSLAELRSLPADASHLEKSNTLMKLRETVLKKESRVNTPPGISRYPHNTFFFMALVLFLSISLFLFISVLLFGD